MINESDLGGLAPGFLEWLHGGEVYSTRHERLCGAFPELDAQDWDCLIKWLYAAYEVGNRNPYPQEPPSMLVVESTRENEDGSLDITIELDEGATKKMAGLGAELALHCAAAGVDIQDVFDYILAQIKNEDVKEAVDGLEF